jgi:hypothetical protein
VESNELLEEALLRVQSSTYQSIPVTSHGQLVGLLTYENIGEFLRVHSALGKTRNEETEFHPLSGNSRREAAQ